MNWLKKTVSSDKEHVLYQSIEKLLIYNGLLTSCKRIYDIGTLLYNAENYKNLLSAIEQNKLPGFLETVDIDVRQDLIDIFLIEYLSESKILLIFDPIELYDNPQILKIISSLDNLDHLAKELIYQKP